MANKYEKRLGQVKSDFFATLTSKVSNDDKPMGNRNIGPSRFKRQQSAQVLPSPEGLDKGLSEAYARALRLFLNEIASLASQSATALELLAQLYETDNRVFADTTDDAGLLAEIYILEANELFLQYAVPYPDKKMLANLVMRLILSDRYGVRSTIAENAHRFLGEPEIRMVIEVLQRLARKEEDRHAQFNYLYLINSFARQIDDHELFQATLETMREHMDPLYWR